MFWLCPTGALFRTPEAIGVGNEGADRRDVRKFSNRDAKRLLPGKRRLARPEKRLNSRHSRTLSDTDTLLFSARRTPGP
jgi:hypothetical protein